MIFVSNPFLLNCVSLYDIVCSMVVLVLFTRLNNFSQISRASKDEKDKQKILLYNRLKLIFVAYLQYFL